MSQNYLSSYKITNVLTDFVSLGLFFIPWSALPCSVPYGKDVAERLLLTSDTFNVLFFLPSFFSNPCDFFFCLYFSFYFGPFDFLSSLPFSFVLSYRCPVIPPVLPAAFVFQIPAAAARKKAGGMRVLQSCAGKQEGNQEPEVGNLTEDCDGQQPWEMNTVWT